MTVSHFDRFLIEATTPDLDPTHRLSEDQLYGLYVSWCRLNHRLPASDADFRAATRQHHGHVSRRRMTGPAAADYILATYPVMI